MLADTHELPPVGLPRGDGVLRAQRERNRVDGNRVAPALLLLGRVALEQPLVVGAIVLLVEARREAKVGELNVTLGVDEDVVRLDVAAQGPVSLGTKRRFMLTAHRWMKPSLWMPSSASTHSAM